MKVALLAARMDTLGGVETVMLRTARWLRDGGHEPILATTAVHAGLETEGVAVRLLGDARAVGRAAAVPALAAATADALRDCDAVCAHNFPAQVWAHAAGLPRVLYACHEPPRHLYEAVMDPVFLASRFSRRRWYTRTWDAWMLARWRTLDQAATRAMPAILTNSPYTAAKIRDIYGRDAEPCWFGPPAGGEGGGGGAGGGRHFPPPMHGWEAENASHSPGGAVREAENASHTSLPRLRVLYAGRLVPMKNLETAIEAVAQVPGVRFRVVGDGDQRSRLEELAARRGARVDFLGTVSEAALEAEYAAADAVLYVPFDEPMGLVPMEAALRGVPSVVSSHGGPAEIVVHGETGLHVDALRAEAVAEALRALQEDPEKRLRMGRAAKDRIRAGMTFEHYARALERWLA